MKDRLKKLLLALLAGLEAEVPFDGSVAEYGNRLSGQAFIATTNRLATALGVEASDVLKRSPRQRQT
ncbi:hypothetical protein [Rhizobium sp. BK538]|uniref:hypothetical protein n=1 Tax=Rhizobium sp. BK538 TaxID=2586984 RepID=UPI00161861C6|nr:hypothetical protein [Rhizobium sp. BK538]MBB4170847.1 hypothetical protein [Rhizobium sp. BK538]